MSDIAGKADLHWECCDTCSQCDDHGCSLLLDATLQVDITTGIVTCEDYEARLTEEDYADMKYHERVDEEVCDD